MTLEEAVKRTRELRARFRAAASADSADPEALRIDFLGKKGPVQALIRSLKEFPPEERHKAGALFNALKEELAASIREMKAGAGERVEPVDITLPGTTRRLGGIHPVRRALREITDIFLGMGFSVKEGPEVEWDYYNFEALNMPEHHPARDMWQTLFITDRMVLRTHTSPVQIRTLEQQTPPVKIIAPGRVYRNDDLDATHSPVFQQIEGLYVDEGVAFTDLVATVKLFVREFFGAETRMKLLPSYFPFTEPSAELLVYWRGEWMEIMGAGMVHPNVLKACHVDPEHYTGFAFGFGLDRLAMVKYGITDIRRLRSGEAALSDWRL